MPSHALSVCSTPGCPELTDRAGRCDRCRREAEQRRPNFRQRGYGYKHEMRFRRGVLRRDRICVICRQAPATVADHWPRGRDELVLLGLDPDDPAYGRGLCESCHNRSTAERQPGGFNRR